MPFSRSRSSDTSFDASFHHAQKPSSVISDQWPVIRRKNPCAHRTFHVTTERRSAHTDHSRSAHNSISEHTPLAGGRPIRTAHPVRHASRHAQRRTRT